MSDATKKFVLIATLMFGIFAGPTIANEHNEPYTSEVPNLQPVLPALNEAFEPLAHSYSQCNESERRWCVRNTKSRSEENACVKRERAKCCNRHDTRSGHRSGCTSS